MLADLPSLLDPEIAENKLGWLKRAVPVVVRDVDSRVAESDYVSPFITDQVSNKPRVLVDLPPLSGSEVVGREIDGTESLFKEVYTPALPQSMTSTLPSLVNSVG